MKCARGIPRNIKAAVCDPPKSKVGYVCPIPQLSSPEHELMS